MQQVNLDNINNSNVLVRVGFDIPNMKSFDRIASSKKTIKKLLAANNKVILATKWGRPLGNFEPNYSTKKLIPIIEGVLEGVPVRYINQFEDGINLQEKIESTYESVIILENIYFDSAENDRENAEKKAFEYSKIANYFVDECFISSHRKDASNFYIKEYLPYAYGLNYSSEIENLDKIKSNSERPFYVIIGGSKLKTKLPIIERMLEISEGVLLCGLLCFTFIKADKNSSLEIHDTKVEDEFLSDARILLEKYPNKILLPQDIVFDTMDGKINGVDIGPKSIDLFKEKISSAKTIFWNGPAGFVEKKPFDLGSFEIADAITNNKNCFKVVGGGDTVAFLNSEMRDGFDYISYAGGATLYFLSN